MHPFQYIGTNTMYDGSSYDDEDILKILSIYVRFE